MRILNDLSRDTVRQECLTDSCIAVNEEVVVRTSDILCKQDGFVIGLPGELSFRSTC